MDKVNNASRYPAKILWRDLFYSCSKKLRLKIFDLIFLAIFDDKYIIVQSLDKIVLTKLGVVEIDKVLEMMIEKHWVGHVQYMTDVSQPKFIIVL